MQLRPATHADAGAIAAIYNEGIADREATFETRPRTPEEVTAWLGEPGPFLVGEDGGTLLGFARVSAYSDRCVYAGVGEHGVYVARAARGAGAGRVVLEAFCRAYAERGFWKVVSRIFPENVASLALHERCGFRVVGVYRRHGKLEGAWRDCVIVERMLDEAP